MPSAHRNQLWFFWLCACEYVLSQEWKSPQPVQLALHQDPRLESGLGFHARLQLALRAAVQQFSVPLVFVWTLQHFTFKGLSLCFAREDSAGQPHHTLLGTCLVPSGASFPSLSFPMFFPLLPPLPSVQSRPKQESACSW